MSKILLKALVALLIGCLFGLPASAKRLKSLSVTPGGSTVDRPIIEVVSDGTKWTHIQPADHRINVRVDIEVGTGWRIGDAFVGVPNADFAGLDRTLAGLPILPENTIRIGGGKDVKKIKRAIFHQFHTGDLAIDGLSLVQMCNSDPGPSTQTKDLHDADIGVGIKAFILTRREAGDLVQGGQSDLRGRSETAYARVPLIVRCLAGPSDIKAPPKPVSVDLKIKKKSDTCPKKIAVTALIRYDEPAVAAFRIRHNRDRTKLIRIEARDTRVRTGGRYLVERTRFYKLDQGKHTFTLKVNGSGESIQKSFTVKCLPFKVTSAWLSYQVEDKQTCKKRVRELATFHANGPGEIPYRIKTQDGLVVAQGKARAAREGDKYVARAGRQFAMGAFDRMMRLEVVNNPAASDTKPLKVECLDVRSGTLQLRGFAASRCQGEAALSIRTSMAGSVPYKLDCTGGRSWSGVVQTRKTGPNTYIGVGTKRFAVSNNEQVNCALKTRAPLRVKAIAARGRKYSCHRREAAARKKAAAEAAARRKLQSADPPVARRRAR